MNFSDTLKIQAKVYAVGYLKIGDKFYYMNDDGTPNLDEEVPNVGDGYDEDGNPIEATATRWLDFGKCVIFPNSRASKVVLADGREYTYSYELVATLKKSKYPLIPVEGDKVWITKADDTIDKEMEVKGFATYKKRYLKLWL